MVWKHLKHCKETLEWTIPICVYIYIHTQCVLPNLFHEPNWETLLHLDKLLFPNLEQAHFRIFPTILPNLSRGLCEVVVIYPNFFRFNPVLPARIPSNPSEKRTFSSEPFQIPLSNLINAGFISNKPGIGSAGRGPQFEVYPKPNYISTINPSAAKKTAGKINRWPSWRWKSSTNPPCRVPSES